MHLAHDGKYLPDIKKIPSFVVETVRGPSVASLVLY